MYSVVFLNRISPVSKFFKKSSLRFYLNLETKGKRQKEWGSQCRKMARSTSSGTSLPEFLRCSGVLSSWAHDPVSRDLNFIICKMEAGVGPCGSIMRNEIAPGTQIRLLFRSFFSLLFLVFPGPCQPGAKKMVLRSTKQHFSDFITNLLCRNFNLPPHAAK